MKKILFLLLVSQIIFAEIISNGAIMLKNSFEYSYFLRKGSFDKFICKNEVLYYRYNHGIAITYNPLTKEPYFCKKGKDKIIVRYKFLSQNKLSLNKNRLK